LNNIKNIFQEINIDSTKNQERMNLLK
jgi:hypothetical protein